MLVVCLSDTLVQDEISGLLDGFPKNLVGCFPITFTKNEFQNNTHTQGEREEISIDIHKIA